MFATLIGRAPVIPAQAGIQSSGAAVDSRLHAIPFNEAEEW